MQACLPTNEAGRLKELYRYLVLDTPPEPAFDRITRTAAHVMKTPMALVSLVDVDRQFFKSSYGTDIKETSREVAFCAHAILSAEPTVVADTVLDERFADNGLVTGEPGIRYYVGAPLITDEGYRLGTLCVVDLEARMAPDADKLKVLQDLAAEVVEQLKFRLARRELVDFALRVEDRQRQVDEHRRKWQDSEARLALALESGQIGTWDWRSGDERITLCGTAERLLGFADGSFKVGVKAWLASIHPDDRVEIRNQLRAFVTARPGKKFALEYRMILPDGSIPTIAAKGAPVYDNGGKFVGARGTCCDITEQKQRERQLRESEELFRGLSACSPVGIFRSDLRGNVTYANPASVGDRRIDSLRFERGGMDEADSSGGSRKIPGVVGGGI